MASDRTTPKGLVTAEVQWRRLTAVERAHVRRQVQNKWSRCQLAKKYAAVWFAVLDAGVLEET